MKKLFWILIGLFTLTSLTCAAPAALIGGAGSGSSDLGKIMFCEEVTDSGKCLNSGTSFPEGTDIIYAYFTYQDMKDGQKWSRIWRHDNKLYDEVKDEIWDGGDQGWMAYTIEDPDGLYGQYTLTISLGDKEVRKASFKVEGEPRDSAQESEEGSSQSFPAFGPITTAREASENAFPIGASKEFEYGITEVVAVFPYVNMSQDLTYAAEWLMDGDELAYEEYPWEDTENGMHSTSLVDDEPLPAGNYILNLYLEDELVRTAKFEIIGEAEPEAEEAAPQPAKRPNRPATPEEISDPTALRYFYMIYQSNLPVLHQVANDNLEGWTEIKVVDNNPCGADAVACFSYACDQRWGGTVYMPAANMAGKSDFEITEVLVHELTHGMQHYGGMKCGCTVEKEFYAFAAELDYLIYSGHQDYFDSQYGRLWDDNGKVDTGLLWNVIKESYGGEDCPDY